MDVLETETRRSQTPEVRGATSGTAAIVHRQLWQATADRLRDEILSGSLGVGAKLNEIDLAERYGVSRVPVREALRALAQTGVVVFVPRKGAFVSTPGDADYEEVYLARHAIETAGVRAAVARVTDGDVRQLRRQLRGVERSYRAGDLESAWAADLLLHRRVMEIAGNGRLLQFFDQLADQTLLLHHHALRETGSATPPVEGLHQAIVDALAARDEERAVGAIERHFGYARDQPFKVGSRR
jgi:DNA-binding GntR family transcriptional regulator